MPFTLIDNAFELDWAFKPSPAPATVRLRRVSSRLRRRIAAPDHRWVRRPSATGDWTLYFVFAADGRLQTAHRFTLDRLARLDRRLLIVCAAPSPEQIPAELGGYADALVWKALPGFDFSAYALGLHGIADAAPGSDVLVLNDSVFGPLHDLAPLLSRMRWDLNGFTASGNIENHVQSYAFLLRDVTPNRMRLLRSVLPRETAYDRFWDVVLCQETRFARVAGRTMTVGALLYAGAGEITDPSLDQALPLLEAGFPFLKRSLTGKFSDRYLPGQVEAALRRYGHPV